MVSMSVPVDIDSNWRWGSICLFFESFHSLLSPHSPFHPSLARQAILCDHSKNQKSSTLLTSSSCNSCSHLQYLHNTLLKILIPPSHSNRKSRSVTASSKLLEGIQYQLDCHQEEWDLVERELKKEKESILITKRTQVSQSNQMNEETNIEIQNNNIYSVLTHQSPNISILCYDSLTPSFRLLLLHLLCDWTVQTKTLHDLIDNMNDMHAPTVYGYDDNKVKYFLFLHPQVERVHFYKEQIIFSIKQSESSFSTISKSSIKTLHSNTSIDLPHITFELLAWDIESCQVAITTLLSHTSQAAKQLVSRVLTEALPQLEQVARQAERRLRRIAKLEVDLGNIIAEEGVNRATRKRKVVDYKEIEESMEEEEQEQHQHQQQYQDQEKDEGEEQNDYQRNSKNRKLNSSEPGDKDDELYEDEEDGIENGEEWAREEGEEAGDEEEKEEDEGLNNGHSLSIHSSSPLTLLYEPSNELTQSIIISEKVAPSTNDCDFNGAGDTAVVSN